MFRYNAQLANNKLDAEQDAAIAATFRLQDLGDCQDGDIGVQCRFVFCKRMKSQKSLLLRCGGFYKGERLELEEAIREADVLLDCDTCSLQILIINR